MIAAAGADNTGLGSLVARGPDFRSDENLFSWRSGVVYKPAENGTLYLSYVRDPDGNKLCALHRPPK